MILEGEFFLMSKGREKFKVILTSRGVFYYVLSNNSNTYVEKSIQISDIVGCHSAGENENGHSHSVVSVVSRSSNNRNNSESDVVDININGVSSRFNASSNASNRSKSFSEGTFRNGEEDISLSKHIPIPRPTEPLGCGFVIFAYPFRKKMFSSKRVRHKLIVGFEIRDSDSKDSIEQRRKEINKWKNVINCLCKDNSVIVNLNLKGL